MAATALNNMCQCNHSAALETVQAKRDMELERSVRLLPISDETFDGIEPLAQCILVYAQLFCRLS